MWVTLLASACGWVYFFAWSVSFYQQPWLNYRRQSVDGLSREFLWYNITGFLFYTTFTTVKYVVQRKYDLAKSVEPNDVLFAAHAAVLTLFTIGQVFYYQGRGRSKPYKMSRLHLAICISFWMAAFVHILLCFVGLVEWYSLSYYGYGYNLMEFFGYSKALISSIKYIPQVYMNYKLKSTVGWAIGNVLLDLTGGLFSLFQQCLVAYENQDWSILYGNVPKLLLSLESIFFDCVFITQHYIIYRASWDPRTKKNERTSLLRGGNGNSGERIARKGGENSNSNSNSNSSGRGSKVKDALGLGADARAEQDAAADGAAEEGDWVPGNPAQLLRAPHAHLHPSQDQVQSDSHDQTHPNKISPPNSRYGTFENAERTDGISPLHSPTHPIRYGDELYDPDSSRGGSTRPSSLS